MPTQSPTASPTGVGPDSASAAATPVDDATPSPDDTLAEGAAAGPESTTEAAPAPVTKPGEAEPHFRHPGFRWLDDSACDGLTSQSFFVEAGHVMGEDARSACLTCTVWQECTIFSYVGGVEGQLINGGYFAGLSLGQRKKMTLGEALRHGARERRAAGIDPGDTSAFEEA